VTTRASVLSPPPQSLFLPLIVAVCGHVMVLGGFMLVDFLSDWFSRTEPLIDPREQIEVSFVQIKGSDRMPTRETVAPAPKGELEAPRPPAPKPIRESDLVSPDARPETQGAPDRSSEREELLREMERKRRMEDALAGAKDREATDPNSDATETIRAGNPGLVRADPELARYVMSVEELFNEGFRPLKPIVDANPGIQAQFHVDFDPVTGRVIDFSPYKPSGNASYDAAVVRAIEAVTAVPLPPDKYKDVVGSRFTITFLPP